jgi:hypothetical protein
MGYSTKYCFLCQAPVSETDFSNKQDQFFNYRINDEIIGLCFNLINKEIILLQGNVSSDFPTFTPSPNFCKQLVSSSVNYYWLQELQSLDESSLGFAYCFHKDCWELFNNLLPRSMKKINIIMYIFNELTDYDEIKHINYGNITKFTGQDFFDSCFHIDIERLPYVLKPLSILEFKNFLFHGINGFNSFKKINFESSLLNNIINIGNNKEIVIPDEILLEIFKYLDLKSVNNISVTCKHYYNLCRKEIYPLYFLKIFNNINYNIEVKQTNNKNKIETYFYNINNYPCIPTFGETNTVRLDLSDIKDTFNMIINCRDTHISTSKDLSGNKFTINWKILTNAIFINKIDPFKLSSRNKLAFSLLNTIRILNICRGLINIMTQYYDKLGFEDSTILSIYNKIQLNERYIKSQVSGLSYANIKDQIDESQLKKLFEVKDSLRLILLKHKESQKLENYERNYISQRNKINIKQNKVFKQLILHPNKKRSNKLITSPWELPKSPPKKKKKINNNNNNNNLLKSSLPDTPSKKPICNKCKIEMSLRTNKNNGNKFWGCKNYFNEEIKCKSIKNINKNI